MNKIEDIGTKIFRLATRVGLAEDDKSFHQKMSALGDEELQKEKTRNSIKLYGHLAVGLLGLGALMIPLEYLVHCVLPAYVVSESIILTRAAINLRRTTIISHVQKERLKS